MNLLRFVLPAIIVLGFCWEVNGDDLPGDVTDAREAAEASQMNCIGWRDQAEWMRDDGLDLKDSALLLRADCVTNGATTGQLALGDNAVGTGDFHHVGAAQKYSTGSAHDATALGNWVMALGHVGAMEWGDAVQRFNDAENGYDVAASNYEDAATDGYYDGYEWFEIAVERFDVLLQSLLM